MKNGRIIPEKGGAGLDELILARSVLLDHLPAGRVPPGDVLRIVHRYSEVTFWEKLLCAAINPRAGKLIAVVSRHRADGYSGILRRHGSIQYIRFFIDWGDPQGFKALGLTHFKVCDAAQDENHDQYPLCHLVSIDFNADRYWDSVMQGFRPKIRVVLSWNQVPELDPKYIPVFGNRVDSQIRVESDKELMLHFNMPVTDKQRAGHSVPCAMTVV